MKLVLLFAQVSLHADPVEISVTDCKQYLTFRLPISYACTKIEERRKEKEVIFMRWKMLLVATALIVAASAIIVAATPTLNTCATSIYTTAFDLNDMVLDGVVTPNGGGDPVPGGGIPK